MTAPFSLPLLSPLIGDPAPSTSALHGDQGTLLHASSTSSCLRLLALQISSSFSYRFLDSESSLFCTLIAMLSSSWFILASMPAQLLSSSCCSFLLDLAAQWFRSQARSASFCFSTVFSSNISSLASPCYDASILLSTSLSTLDSSLLYWSILCIYCLGLLCCYISCCSDPLGMATLPDIITLTVLRLYRRK